MFYVWFWMQVLAADLDIMADANDFTCEVGAADPWKYNINY